MKINERKIERPHIIRRVVIGLITLCFAMPFLGAQVVLSGLVLDKADHSPLIGAHISFPELDRRTVTDIDGHFSLVNLPEGDYQLVISYAGKTTYRETIQLVKGQQRIRIQLEDEAQLLTQVNVRADQEESFGLARLRAVEGVAIYEGKKSEVVVLNDLAANLAANNPRQVYGRVAGLNIWESDGAGLQLGIGGRGLSPNRTANFNTRQNGYDISADALGYPESYYTPPTEALDRIQVVRGAASLQYGTQFGGMLNFVFKRPPSDKKISLVSRQTIGSYGFLGTYNQLAGTLADGQFSYFAYYQYKQGNGWRPNSGFDMHNAFAALQWKPTDRLGFGLELTRMHYLAQQGGGLTDALFERDARASYRERNWFQVDWNLLAFTLDYRLSERTRLNVRNFGLLAGRQSLGVLSPINVTDFGENRDLIEGSFKNMGNETRLLHRYRIGTQEHTFVAGFRLYRGLTSARQGTGNDGSGPDFYFLDPENIDKSDYTFPNTNYAVFAEHIFRLGNHWSLTPGIRYEYIHTRAEGYYQQQVYDAAGNLVAESRQEEATSRKRGFLLMGLGASWKPSDKYEFYANFSQNYRAIN
ncbi:MAG: TonB-dependent receptor, partial [Lewinella sp.]|nr:TonB-dependent receptor [Lewinella sp.]